MLSSIIGLFAGLLAGSFCINTLAQESKPDFPKVLTLPRALSMIDDDNPALLRHRADNTRVIAQNKDLDNLTALQARIEFDLRAVDRIAVPGHNYTDDSRILLTLDKPLSFFGRTDALEESIQSQLTALEQTRLDTHASLRLNVIRSFFDVILSDYAYATKDELMTLSYLTYDRARERFEIYNELAEVDIRQLESIYIEALARRAEASNARRNARLRLALVLNRPDAYPDQLVEPDLSRYQREIPSYEVLLAQVLGNNPTLKAKKLTLQSLKHKSSYLAHSKRPTLGTRFQAAEYEKRSFSSRDQFRASLYLTIPLTPPRKVTAEIVTLQADIQQQESEIALLENTLREQTLGLIQQLELLRFEIMSAESNLLYRELELDKVRLQYEMELRSSIGTANAALADAVYKLAAARYQHAFVWEQIDVLSSSTPTTFD